MEEDFAIEILELYKTHHKLDRHHAFSMLQQNTLNVSASQFDELIHTFLQRNLLMESGTPNTYLYWPTADDFLTKLKIKKGDRDKLKRRKERAESRKDWKESHWLLIAIGAFTIGVITTPIVSAITPVMQKKWQSLLGQDTTASNSAIYDTTFRSHPYKDSLQNLKPKTIK